MSFELGPMQEKWLRAAESGRYKQTFGVMQNGRACCFLGLAKRVCRLRDESKYCLGDAYEKLGLRSQGGSFRRKRVVARGICVSSLWSANDQGLTFAEIAAFIRANPEVVFKEAK